MITVTREPHRNAPCGQCPVHLDKSGIPVDPPLAPIRIVVFECFRMSVCLTCALKFSDSAAKAVLSVRAESKDHERCDREQLVAEQVDKLSDMVAACPSRDYRADPCLGVEGHEGPHWTIRGGMRTW